MRFFIFISCLLFAATTYSQETITVKNTKNESLPGASVSYLKTGTVTDNNGTAQLPKLPKGTLITVSYIGYNDITTAYTGSAMTFVLEEKGVLLEELVVKAIRVKKDAPIAFSNISKEEIANQNLGQDIPFLLNSLPGVVTTSDAGAGIGYTGIRVRGSDATRVNVTINGIPLNDAESHGVFWVNMPDFASSVENLQLQRGVGTSTNGAGAFGASLNLLTNNTSEKSFAEISNSFGSFNTWKHTVKLGTGKINEHFEVVGRLSKITSDGYIDRASSDLKSYFLQGTYSDEKTMLKALVFGGKEKTYQAWNGIDGKKLKTNRTYNPSGKYTDANGKKQFYDNETDNYQQDHYQLHWNQKINNNWSSHIGLHYTQGEGYYENYKNDPYSEYGLQPIKDVQGKEVTGNLIRRKWLDNDFYGGVFSLDYQKSNLNLILGGGLNNYKGDHFGTIIWTERDGKASYKEKYYNNRSKKLDGNIYVKATYKIDANWQAFADFQYRFINYEMDSNNIDEQLHFFNPKAGLTYFVTPYNSLYFSYARGNKEPNRNDYEANADVKPETLNDFELGWRYANSSFNINANAYYMLYQDQLVLIGEINHVGAFIRSNVGESYRLGLEIDANWNISHKWKIHPNIAISSNKNIEFKEEDSNKKIKNLGNTNISFSPNLVAGNSLTFSPKSNVQIALLSKFVGEQYMSNNNIEASKLDSYFINNLSIGWQVKPSKIFKSIDFSLLINNIFNVEYVSNGYMWSIYPYYFPQAKANVLAGITLKF